jgi:hypothetical protein
MNTPQDLSAEARSAKVDHLDAAIDAVAERLTRVSDDDELAQRIVNALPERVTWFGWLLHSWAPRLAMVAVVVAASGIIGGNRREVSTPDVSPLASSQPITTPLPLAASVRAAAPNRTMPLERLQPAEPPEPSRSDFDRSLPSIGEVAALSIDSLVPASLPEDAPLTLRPLAIVELPLTAEPISPEEQR